MKYFKVKSGNEELEFSKVIVGSTMSMAGMEEKEVFRIYDKYAELGGNSIDTARAYNNYQAEDMVARWLQTRKDKERFVITTKGGQPKEEAPEVGRIDKVSLEEDLNASLKALNTDHIDLYWVHKDDETYPAEKLIETMNDFKRAGKIRMFGCSNWSIARIEKANAYAKENGLEGFAASQIQWSLARTQIPEYFLTNFGSVCMNEKQYNWYYENNIPIFSFSSQAQGFFPRLDALGKDGIPADLLEQYGSEDNFNILERIKEYAKEHNATISAVALAYLINNKLSCAALIGAQSVEMLEESLKAVELDMSAEEADRIFYGGK